MSLFPTKHEIEMADLILDELANDGTNRAWADCKQVAADRLREMGMSEDAAYVAIRIAIQSRST